MPDNRKEDIEIICHKCGQYLQYKITTAMEIAPCQHCLATAVNSFVDDMKMYAEEHIQGFLAYPLHLPKKG